MTLRDEKPAHTPGGALPGPEVESLDRNGGDAPAVTTTAAGSAPFAGERAARTFRCRDCGEVREVETRTGPLPTVCDACNPEAAERRREQRASSQAFAERRHLEVRQLRERVAELERLLAVDADITTRAAGIDHRDPDTTGRMLVGRAVRAVAHAEGKAATRDALLDLAAAARAWVRVIDGPTSADLDAEPDWSEAA